MKTRYSKSTNNFYPFDIDYSDLPADVQEVSMEDYYAVMNRPSGSTFDFDEDGNLTITPAAPATVNPNADVMQQILEIEATVTQRRLREAMLGIDDGWLKAADDRITELRKQLK